MEVVRRRLAAGDYAVELDGRLIAAVERKSLPDLLSSLTSGKLRYALADLSALPRAAVVVEDRWSEVFRLPHVRPGVVPDGLAEAQVRWPGIPIVFTETRRLAEEWTYRWLAAALVAARDEGGGAERLAALTEAGVLSPQPPPAPTPASIRAWAAARGLPVSDRGRLRPEVVAAYDAEHR